MRRISLVRLPRVRNEAAALSNSSTIQPIPAPKTTRPFEITLAVATALAVINGWRIGTMYTFVTNRRRVVRGRHGADHHPHIGPIIGLGPRPHPAGIRRLDQGGNSEMIGEGEPGETKPLCLGSNGKEVIVRERRSD